MALIGNAAFKAYCDRLAAYYTQAKNALGNGSGSTGTGRGTFVNFLADIVALNDFDQEVSLAPAVNTGLGNAPVAQSCSWLAKVLSALSLLCQSKGGTVDSTIVDFTTYLAYYNATPFTVELTPDFAAMYLDLYGAAMSPVHIMSPALHPDYTAGVSAHGMGDRNIATSTTTVGTGVTTASYHEVVPLIEVTTDFANGSSPPAITFTGTDSAGATSTWGPITLTGNNPSGPLSGVTTSGAVTAGSRQTVTLSSATGVIAGSVLTINKTLVDQEVIIVESVSGSDITAVFRTAHSSGATVDGYATYSAGSPSPSSTRRLRTFLTMTPTLHSHDTGIVRIVGKQPRVSV